MLDTGCCFPGLIAPVKAAPLVIYEKFNGVKIDWVETESGIIPSTFGLQPLTLRPTPDT